MKPRYFLAAVLGALVAFSTVAQTIPSPAGSTDSGSRAMVGIAPVDLSSYATKVEVINVSNTANTAYNTAITANDKANSAFTYGYSAYVNQGYNKPWSQWFLGSQQSAAGAQSGYTYYVLVNGAGQLYVNSLATNNQWVYMGSPSGSQPVQWFTGCITGECVHEMVQAYPINSDANGVPSSWTVRVSNALNYFSPTTDTPAGQ